MVTTTIAQHSPLMSGTHYYGYDRPTDHSHQQFITEPKWQLKISTFFTSFFLQATFARTPALY